MVAFDLPLKALGIPPPLGPDDVVADWNCPVCRKHTPRTHRPGRPPVYCSNRCRQKAYRYRRDHGIRLLHHDGQPAHRAAGASVTHLTRPVGDPVAGRRASNQRCVSLCGAFVRPAADFDHLDPTFEFDDARACWRCLELTGAGIPDVPMIYPWQVRLRGYTGPPVAPVPARVGYMASLRGKPPKWRRRRRKTSAPPTEAAAYGAQDGPPHELEGPPRRR
jgi:hypothetical protein